MSYAVLAMIGIMSIVVSHVMAGYRQHARRICGVGELQMQSSVPIRCIFA